MDLTKLALLRTKLQVVVTDTIHGSSKAGVMLLHIFSLHQMSSIIASNRCISLTLSEIVRW